MKTILEKAVENPRKAVKVALYKFCKPLGHSKFRRFIILSQSRTGSNLLVSFLNAHPNIHTDGEIFGRLKGRDYKMVLRSVFDRQPFYIKAAGFKIFYYHPVDAAECGIWNDLESMKELAVIHLKRRNILRTIISRRIAEQQQIYSMPAHREVATAAPKKIVLPIDQAEAAFNTIRAWEHQGDERFSGHPKITMYYEDLVADPIAEMGRVFAFLCLDYVQPRTNLRKQNPEKASEIISNFGALATHFQSTEFATHFVEE